MEAPIEYTFPMSGIILGRKTPKYNRTLRATAPTPTTSTTFGLLSFRSNLLTLSVTILSYFLALHNNNAKSEAASEKPPR
jgi:hypothetical protein